VMDRVRQVVRDISPHDSVERYERLGVECISGRAEIKDPHHVRVNGRTLQTKSLVLALGAAPIVPAIPGLHDVSPLTSENLWNERELPKKLAVLGGGPIGCEMAQAFARLGSEVFLIDREPHLLSKEDPDMAEWVAKSMTADGVKLYLGYEAREIIPGSPHHICLRRLHEGNSPPPAAPHSPAQPTKNDGKNTLKIPFDKILVAVGRRARTDQHDWKELGISLNPDGTLKADRYLRLNGKSIYACGDVVGPYQLTHAASHQAWYCAVNGLFSPWKKFAVDYRVIPWVTFTDPEFARVGLSEKEARLQGIAHQVTRYGLDDFDRALADSENRGEIKILTHPKNDEILGVSIVGTAAGDMLAEFTLAMKWRLGLKSILRTIHPYPTWSEANKYGASAWAREKSQILLQRVDPLLSTFHRWRR